jgi:hypothetical protein
MLPDWVVGDFRQAGSGYRRGLGLAQLSSVPLRILSHDVVTSSLPSLNKRRDHEDEAIRLDIHGYVDIVTLMSVSQLRSQINHVLHRKLQPSIIQEIYQDFSIQDISAGPIVVIIALSQVPDRDLHQNNRNTRCATIPP